MQPSIGSVMHKSPRAINVTSRIVKNSEKGVWLYIIGYSPLVYAHRRAFKVNSPQIFIGPSTQTNLAINLGLAPVRSHSCLVSSDYVTPKRSVQLYYGKSIIPFHVENTAMTRVLVQWVFPTTSTPCSIYSECCTPFEIEQGQDEQLPHLPRLIQHETFNLKAPTTTNSLFTFLLALSIR